MAVNYTNWLTAKESRPREGTRLAKDTQHTSGPHRLRTAFSGHEFLHMGFAPYKTAAGRGRASPTVHSEDKGNPSGVQWCVFTFRDPDSFSLMGNWQFPSYAPKCIYIAMYEKKEKIVS